MNVERYTWEDAVIEAETQGLISAGAVNLCLRLAKAINWLPGNKRKGQPSGLYWKNETALKAVNSSRATYYRYREELFQAGLFTEIDGNLIPLVPDLSHIETEESRVETTESHIETPQSQIETNVSQVDNPYSEDIYSEDSYTVDTYSAMDAEASGVADAPPTYKNESVKNISVEPSGCAAPGENLLNLSIDNPESPNIPQESGDNLNGPSMRGAAPAVEGAAIATECPESASGNQNVSGPTKGVLKMLDERERRIVERARQLQLEKMKRNNLPDYVLRAMGAK